MRTKRVFISLGTWIGLMTPAALGQNYRLVELPPLPGGLYSHARAINELGHVAGGARQGRTRRSQSYQGRSARAAASGRS